MLEPSSRERSSATAITASRSAAHTAMTSGRIRLEVNGAAVARRPNGVTQLSHGWRWVSATARRAKQLQDEGGRQWGQAPESGGAQDLDRSLLLGGTGEAHGHHEPQHCYQQRHERADLPGM